MEGLILPGWGMTEFELVRGGAKVVVSKSSIGTSVNVLK